MAFFLVYVGLDPSAYKELTLLEREAIIVAFKERHKKQAG